jgi:hypothetical protein
MSVALWMMKQDEGTCNLREIALNLHAPMHARSGSTMSLRLLVSLLNPIRTHLPAGTTLVGYQMGVSFCPPDSGFVGRGTNGRYMYSQLFLLY